MTEIELRVYLPLGMSHDDARLLLATKAFETGRASLGQAARIAGLSKKAFIELLGRQGVPVFDYPADELRAEIDS